MRVESTTRVNAVGAMEPYTPSDAHSRGKRIAHQAVAEQQAKIPTLSEILGGLLKYVHTVIATAFSSKSKVAEPTLAGRKYAKTSTVLGAATGGQEDTDFVSLAPEQQTPATTLTREQFELLVHGKGPRQ